MASRGVAQEGLSVHVRGRFIPTLFSPSWFYIQSLVGLTELENSTIDAITSEFASFKMGWLRVQVTPDFLQLSTEASEEFERLRDAALGTLSALDDLEVSQLGLNRDFHISVDSKEELHRIGDTLTPKGIWAGVLGIAGMKDVTLWGVRPDQYAGRVHITVQPSNVVEQSVFVLVNDHYTLREVSVQLTSRSEIWNEEAEDGVASSGKLALALRIIENDWHDSLARADRLQQHVLSMGKAQ